MLFQRVHPCPQIEWKTKRRAIFKENYKEKGTKVQPNHYSARVGILIGSIEQPMAEAMINVRNGRRLLF